jgi:hypothetical protein
MPYEATYNHSVLALLAARMAEPNCTVAVFLGRHQRLVAEMNQRWTDATQAAGLPSPPRILILLAT